MERVNAPEDNFPMEGPFELSGEYIRTHLAHHPSMDEIESMQAGPLGIAAPALIAGWGAYASPGPSGNPSDSQVAANHREHVIVTARDTIEVHTKGGRLLQGPKEGSAFFNNLFVSLGLTQANYKFFDMRTLWDPWTQRFFVIQAVVLKVPNSTGYDPRVLLAVSSSSDPMDTWWQYSFPGISTASNPCNGAQVNTQDGPDYPLMGVDQEALYVTTTTESESDGFFTNKCTFPRAFSTLDLINNVANPRRIGWAYWTLPNSSNILNSGLLPARHRTISAEGGYHLSFFTGSSSDLVVWRVVDPLNTNGNRHVEAEKKNIQNISPPISTAHQAPDNSSTVTIRTGFGGLPMGAEWVNNKLYSVFSDSGLCTADNTVRTKVRYIRQNTANFGTSGVTNEIDQTFGCRESSDPTIQSFHYGWPTIAVTTDQDAVIPMNRFRQSIWPEISAGMFANGSSSRSDNRFVKASLDTYRDAAALAAGSPANWADTAGSCVDDNTLDSSTNRGVWIAHQYANSNSGDLNWGVWVAKIQGVGHADLAPGPIVLNNTTLQKGLSSGQHYAFYENRGDGAANANGTISGVFKLSTNRFISQSDFTLATFIIPSGLAPNSYAATELQTLNIPCSWPSGTSYIGILLDTTEVVDEYDEGNNGNGTRGSSEAAEAVTIVGTTSCP